MLRLGTAMLAVCLLICTTPALASTTGLLRGVVTFAGKPQAAALVTLTGAGSSFSTTTTANGAYHFSEVPFGHYHLSVHVGGGR